MQIFIKGRGPRRDRAPTSTAGVGSCPNPAAAATASRAAWVLLGDKSAQPRVAALIYLRGMLRCCAFLCGLTPPLKAAICERSAPPVPQPFADAPTSRPCDQKTGEKNVSKGVEAHGRSAESRRQAAH